MNLIKTSLLNSISVVIKILALLGINKLLAIYVGPAGYAAIGQLQNVIQMILTVSGGALNNGVTKYTAEYAGYEDKNSQVLLWSTAFKINIICSSILSLSLFLCSGSLSLLFFKDESFKFVFICLSFTLLFASLNAFLLSILNGKKQVVKYVKINIVNSVFSLLFTGGAAFYFGLEGALIALVSNQSIVFFVTICFCIKQPWFQLSSFLQQFNNYQAKKVSSFAFAAVVSAIVIPLSHIGIREHLLFTVGWEQAGYWDAMWKISSVYLMFITMTLTVYYLPRFSEITIKSELRSELIKGYKLIVPVVFFLSLSMYLFRDFIVNILFNSDFLAMSELFKWQLIGDSLKIISWLLGYVLLGQALIRLFICAEIIFSGIFYILSVSLINEFGVVGVTYAHTVNYAAYFLFILFALVRKKII